MIQPREHLESKIWNLEERVQQLETILAELLAAYEQMQNEDDVAKIMTSGFRLTEAIVNAKKALLD